MSLDVNSIKEEFQAFGIKIQDSNAVIDKCAELCSRYGLDAENLVVHWITFAQNTDASEITLDHLENFERDYVAKKKNTRSSLIKTATPRPSLHQLHQQQGIYSEVDDLIISAYGASPAQKKLELLRNEAREDGGRSVSKSPKTPQGRQSSYSTPDHSPLTRGLSPKVTRKSQRFAERTNPGDVVFQFPDLGAGSSDLSEKNWTKSSYDPQVKVSGLDSDNLSKMMFEKVRVTADLEEDAILHIADEIAPAFGGDDCWSATDSTSNVAINCVGRICCDSLGKLNSASVLLEGSRKHASALVQRLDLSKLEHYAIFPGQVVGVTGVNLHDRLVVENMVGGKVLPFPDQPITLSEDTGPIQMVIAAGPFTTHDNLLFEPLADLLSAISKQPPHLLVLVGPLLDASHPLLEEPTTTETYQDVVNRVLSMITAGLTRDSTEVFVVASPKDVTSDGVFPCYPLKALTSPRIHLVSDPCILEVEGVVVALTSMDVIMDLSKEEISFPGNQSNRLDRIVHHILAQQCLYPLNPPPEHVLISPSLLQTHATINCKPHLLVLPSTIKHFVKDVVGCVAVNPERLCKGASGGFYVRLELRPPTDDPQKPNIVAAVLRV